MEIARHALIEDIEFTYFFERFKKHIFYPITMDNFKDVEINF